MWNELLEKIREEILYLQLVDKTIVDSYNQFTFTIKVSTEVDPLTAIPQEVKLILSYEESASIGLSELVYRHTYLRTEVSCTCFIHVPVYQCDIV